MNESREHQYLSREQGKPWEALGKTDKRDRKTTQKRSRNSAVKVTVQVGQWKERNGQEGQMLPRCQIR